jgi:hypothetical protein
MATQQDRPNVEVIQLKSLKAGGAPHSEAEIPRRRCVAAGIQDLRTVAVPLSVAEIDDRAIRNGRRVAHVAERDQLNLPKPHDRRAGSASRGRGLSIPGCLRTYSRQRSRRSKCPRGAQA